MKALLVEDGKLVTGEAPDPQIGPGQLLVRVHCAGVNRADLLQKAGKYPPPAGASPLLGLEVSGRVIQTNGNCKHREGDEICALLPGGGYAEYALVEDPLAMKIPKGISLRDAAGIPEVFLTAYQSLIWIAGLQKKETVLIHAGASGVGSAALQIAKDYDCTVFTTCSESKTELCRSLGASRIIDYNKENFVDVIKNSDAAGADVIIDFLAASVVNENLKVLKTDGRMVMLALLGGIKAEQVNLVSIVTKRLTVTGSTLRSRSVDYQSKLVQDFYGYACSKFENGTFKPVIDSVFSARDAKEAEAAHDRMNSRKNAGKILLDFSV